MPRVSAFSIAQTDIEARLQVEARPVYSYRDLTEIFYEQGKAWRLPSSWGPADFVSALRDNTDKLHEVKIAFPRVTYDRYSWGAVPSDMVLALSVGNASFVSHYTAMAYHQLTDQQPTRIYLSSERAIKPSGQRTPLTQDTIDAAFRQPQRASSNVAVLPSGQSIVRVMSNYTGRLGVIRGTDGLSITSLERTLVDATIRPIYSGGVDEVLEAYRRAGSGGASERVSVNKLVAYLKKLAPIYPYHQAIGFYMERSGGFSSSLVNRMREFQAAFDFYLTYEMKDPKYSAEWKLYYPASMD